MDLIDKIRELSLKIPKLKEGGLIKTEEGTKNALIMPFINALGYNVFDPTEVTPELIADVGTKKGEKVDYAILKDGKPVILFECKSWGTDLNQVHASQLYRYFSVTSARFGVLTDGVVYRFYTDLDAPNIMDKDPFFVFSLLDFKEAHVEELKKFTKPVFDVDRIVTAASELKYKGLVKAYLQSMFSQPTEAFVRLALQESKAYTGRFTQGVIEEFTPIIREAFRLFINEQVENRLKTALASEQAEAAKSAVAPEEDVTVDEQPSVETTQEETEAYLIVKAILREIVDPQRIIMRDAQSYCSVLLDDNNRKSICRLRLNSPTHKYLGVFNEQKQEERIAINTVDDIYKHADRLRATALAYLGNT